MKKYWPAAAVLVSLVAGTALANDETLSFAKATDGSILITLSGVIPYCDALMGGGFQGSPQFTINGNQIGITSTVLLGECPAPPPGFPPPASTPYSLTISAGQLPNGTYTVTWSLLNTNQVVRSATATLIISAMLPASVPLFTTIGAGLLLLTLCAVGGMVLRT
jgi:hypothetical protein